MSEALKSHAAVLFSGGTDSTLAAARILQNHERVTLLTLDPGYIFFVDNTRKHAGILQERFGAERVTHHILDVKEAVRAVAAKDIPGDLKEYGFNMSSLVCLTCRLSMHAFTVAWCLENEVAYIADGSIRAQSTVPEQMASVIRRNGRFYASEYGIQHISPIYDVDDSDRQLDALGLSAVKKLKKQFIFFDTQPTCLFGVPADVYGRIFYGKLVGDQREEDSEQMCTEKYPLMREYIAMAVARAGGSVPEAVAKLRAIRAADDAALAG